MGLSLFAVNIRGYIFILMINAVQAFGPSNNKITLPF
jgi:hypothetical protein